ncbi:MAG: cation diffusion facilitator family transporter [Promethearchaeota archaeon]
MTDSAKDFQKKARTATLVALSVNTILGLLKIISGLFISSMSLIADGFDSLMDLFMGMFAFLGATIAQKPADEDHLYGHEKIEMIYLLLIIGIILITGLGIFLQALDRFINRIELQFSTLGLLIIFISILGKFLISIFVYQTARQINSTSLKATALNYATDIFSSFLVLLALIGAYINIGIIDSLAAIVIALLITYGAIKMLNESLNILLDRAPSEMILDQIYELATSIKGVREVHKLRARIIGNRIVGDMHVLVDPNLTVQEGHDISDNILNILQRELEANIVVHLEPYKEKG